MFRMRRLASSVSLMAKLDLLVILLISVLLAGCSEDFSATGDSPLIFDQEKYNTADELRGGRLYDAWWTEKGQSTPPTSVNPLWREIAVDSSGKPFNNHGNDGGQWRCKECHGWDYKGYQGAYSITTDRYTGFKGVKNSSTTYTAEYIYSKIAKGVVDIDGKQIEHRFYDADWILNEKDLYDLTRFIAEIAATDDINPELGDVEAGQQVYEAHGSGRLSCASIGCHKSTVPQLIDVAQHDVEQFLHKVRFGSPGSLMPAGLINSDAQNIWAFINAGAQTTEIPTSNFDADIYTALTKTDVVKGAQLYDRWWLVSNASTAIADSESHPLWPASNAEHSNNETWRCASCHGWDYLGKDGNFAQGIYATGIKGIVSTAQTDILMPTADNVYSFLKESESHGFNNQFFSDEEYYTLTKFIMTQREEFAANSSPVIAINKASHYVENANVGSGQSAYENNSAGCSGCHGSDGKQIALTHNNIHHSSLYDPWSFVHAVRFGKPGTAMNGLYVNEDATLSSSQTVTNILAYSQRSLIPNTTRGALLYDQWWSVNGVKITSPPAFRNKQWVASSGSADTSLVSDAETWRCANCHGWDYDGAQGRLSDNQQQFYSGITGFYFLDTKLKDKAIIASIIANGSANIQDHTFSKYLSIEDIDDIVEFIVNDSSGIPASKADYNLAINNGDVSAGKTLFESSTTSACQICHGVNGNALSTTNLADLSTNHPEQFIHKIQYGHPGSAMVNQFDRYTVHSRNDAADILEHSQSLLTTQNTADYSSASLIRGGRLYENWLLEKQQSTNVDTPTAANPMWSDERGFVPDDINETWQCSRCHGWDYLGMVAESGDNLVEAISTLQSTMSNTELQNHVFNRIKSGINSQHNFGTSSSNLPTALNDRDIWDLTKFIVGGGVIDLRNYTHNGSLSVEIDENNGQGLYLGSTHQAINCASCHGYYGETQIAGASNTELDIFRTASAFQFPFRSLHLFRFGKAGSNMAGIEIHADIDYNNALDILGYMQKRYIER